MCSCQLWSIRTYGRRRYINTVLFVLMRAAAHRNTANKTFRGQNVCALRAFRYLQNKCSLRVFYEAFKTPVYLHNTSAVYSIAAVSTFAAFDKIEIWNSDVSPLTTTVSWSVDPPINFDCHVKKGSLFASAHVDIHFKCGVFIVIWCDWEKNVCASCSTWHDWRLSFWRDIRTLTPCLFN